MRDCVEIINLSKTYRLPNQRKVLALDQVNLTVKKGEFFGFVGESGSGKTTLAKCVLRLIQPDSGTILLNGEDWLAFKGKKLRKKRRDVQLIFQDPYTSLNPLFKVAQIVKEPLKVQSIGDELEQNKRVEQTLELVRLPNDLIGRYPHELSGGQRQRVAIARALISQPSLLIADEPVSSLDQQLQGQLTRLFAELCQETDVSLIYITHDLRVVKEWSSRIGVMHQGKLLETGTPEQIITKPQTRYTRQLIEEAFPELKLD